MYATHTQIQSTHTATSTKQRLRSSMKIRLKAHHSVKSMITHLYILRKSLVWKSAEVVCMFWPMAGEVDTRPLLRMAHNTKKRVWIPLPHAKPQYMRTISCASLVPLHQRYINYGVKTTDMHTPFISHQSCMRHPNGRYTSKDISISAWLRHNAQKTMLVLVPGLAFSFCGIRLGHGGGFYDRLLAMLQRCNRTLYCVGLCHEMQLLSHIPTDKHDKKMAYIITENRCITCTEHHTL